jgi:hypothetical protein
MSGRPRADSRGMSRLGSRHRSVLQIGASLEGPKVDRSPLFGSSRGSDRPLVADGPPGAPPGRSGTRIGRRITVPATAIPGFRLARGALRMDTGVVRAAEAPPTRSARSSRLRADSRGPQGAPAAGIPFIPNRARSGEPRPDTGRRYAVDGLPDHRPRQGDHRLSCAAARNGIDRSDIRGGRKGGDRHHGDGRTLASAEESSIRGDATLPDADRPERPADRARPRPSSHRVGRGISTDPSESGRRDHAS